MSLIESEIVILGDDGAEEPVRPRGVVRVTGFTEVISDDPSMLNRHRMSEIFAPGKR
ncbi:hypothetical protein ABZT08_01725 [Streptomyces sp. NPDC005526]|uniref:hypothetical protein n=1 Tax=Streptomyces sp. NPDC005526 TaxID=3156885 RepID=UPI0033B99A28